MVNSSECLPIRNFTPRLKRRLSKRRQEAEAANKVRQAGSKSAAASLKNQAALQELNKLWMQKNMAQEVSSELTAENRKASSSKKVSQTIKNLFGITSNRFSKPKKQGVYLTTLIMCEDRVMLTPEGIPPTIKVTESSASLQKELQWINKLGSSWDEVSSMQASLAKIPSIPAKLALRAKVLDATSKMQALLGIQNLGQIHYESVTCESGAQLILTLIQVESVADIPYPNAKWSATSKVQNSTGTQVTGILDSMMEESQSPLPAGLYLGYLKLESSMDSIKLSVPASRKTMLPYHKLRANSAVAQQEWDWIQSLNSSQPPRPDTTPEQLAFQNLLQRGSAQLMEALTIEKDSASQHRIYPEVIKLSEDVSLIIMMPAVTEVCTGPGQKNPLIDNSFLTSIPITSFEHTNMSCFNPAVTRQYAQLACTLEMETHVSQQAQREAFSNEEARHAKSYAQCIAKLLDCAEEAWNGVRWIPDVIRFARDKTSEAGTTVNHLDMK